ncbi:hypothetical protein F2P79_004259 [Pimephales promelas]|nr:hypothetical protein F2P79_004259 [Pimephales promelas]
MCHIVFKISCEGYIWQQLTSSCQRMQNAESSWRALNLVSCLHIDSTLGHQDTPSRWSSFSQRRVVVRPKERCQASATYSNEVTALGEAQAEDKRHVGRQHEKRLAFHRLRLNNLLWEEVQEMSCD